MRSNYLVAIAATLGLAQFATLAHAALDSSVAPFSVAVGTNTHALGIFQDTRQDTYSSASSFLGAIYYTDVLVAPQVGVAGSASIYAVRDLTTTTTTYDRQVFSVGVGSMQPQAGGTTATFKGYVNPATTLLEGGVGTLSIDLAAMGFAGAGVEDGSVTATVSVSSGDKVLQTLKYSRGLILSDVGGAFTSDSLHTSVTYNFNAPVLFSGSITASSADVLSQLQFSLNGTITKFVSQATSVQTGYESILIKKVDLAALPKPVGNVPEADGTLLALAGFGLVGLVVARRRKAA
jgi:hypothetical protein